MGRKPRPLGSSFEFSGVATHVGQHDEAGEWVMKFVVRCEDRDPIAVEMRGEKLLGILNEGDDVRVSLPGGFDRLEDRTLRPLKVKNLTTGGAVSVYRAGLRRKALRAGFSSAGDAWKALIALVIGLLAAAAGITGQASIVVAGAPVWMLIAAECIWLALWAAGYYLIVYRRWRWEGGPLWVWLPLGLALAVAIFIAGMWWRYSDAWVDPNAKAHAQVQRFTTPDFAVKLTYAQSAEV